MRKTGKGPGRRPDPLAAEFAHKLRERLEDRLKKVILFGSRARGDARADSDYDFLVIVDRVDKTVRRTIDEVAGDFFVETCIPFGAFEVEEAEYDRRVYHPLLMNVREDGVLL